LIRKEERGVLTPSGGKEKEVLTPVQEGRRRELIIAFLREEGGS